MEKNISAYEPFIHHLNEHEAAHPGQVIDDFFRFSTLPESILLLWQWLRIMKGEEFDALKDEEQDRLLLFYVNLEKLVETSYLLKARSSQS